ncbi:MAG: HAD family hydrolase [Planctomycetes bacterium]|nr:HAD family hydrolase [Planctomycetota bacterium]
MEIPENIKLIVFDLDGTIIDLDVDWACLKERLHRRTLKEYNYDCDFNRLDESLILIKNKFGQDAYSKLINMIADEEINGVKTGNLKQEMIGFIKKRYVPNMAIFSSNTKRAIEYSLKRLGLSSFFSCIISKEDVTNPKPSSEGLKKIISFYGVSNKDILFIGNTNADKEAGKNAGVTTYIYE